MKPDAGTSRRFALLLIDFINPMEFDGAKRRVLRRSSKLPATPQTSGGVPRRKVCR